MSRRLLLKLSLILNLLFGLGLVGCGSGSSVGDHSLGAVPESWGKYLAAGSISATLDVYNSQGKSALHQDLSVDLAAGTVTAPQFKLPIGDTYRFVIIFNYSLTPTEAIPYAYADFSWLVDEYSEAVSFSENDIRYSYDEQDPLVSASLSEGKIPNLDLDSDGWSNWEELRDKVNPKDPQSVPILPSVEVRGVQDGASNTATITVTARDNAHVETLKLVDPVCGVTVISDTLANNVDGSVTRTLVLRLDLLSVSKNPRTLQALADDGVTPAQNATATLNFQWSGGASQPYFVFVEPEENGELEGPAVFRGVACSRQDISVHDIRFLNSELQGTHWSGSQNPSTGDYEVVSDAVDTSLLPDGLINLKVEVEDAAGKLGQGNRSFRIVNDSQLRIVEPAGRRWVFGQERIAVSVKNQTNTNLVLISGPNFQLESSSPVGAFGYLKVDNLQEGTVLPLTFKAVRSDGSEILRKVDFTVRNKPQLQVQPAAPSVFRNWSTNLVYRVTNVDPAQLFVAGMSTGAKGARQCAEDPVAIGITVCSGQFPVKITQGSAFNVTAARTPTVGETCLNCSTTQDVAVGVLSPLPNDIPEINAKIAGDDDTDEAGGTPEKVRVPIETPAKQYRLRMKNLRTGSLDFEGEGASGATFTLNGLQARTDYLATLEVLSGPGGNTLSEMFKEVTTGDLGLVGWWRFKDDPNAVDCPGETSSKTLCDFSGKGNHGDPTNPLQWIIGDSLLKDGAIDLNGSQAVVISHNPSLEISDELTMSCLIDPSTGLPVRDMGILVKDNPQPGPFSLVEDSDGLIGGGVYTFESGIGSWKESFVNISSFFGEPFRISIIYDGFQLRLYIGNQLMGSKTVMGVINNFPQTLWIGFNPYTNGYFDGILYDCIIFDRSLNDGELNSL
ncbi:MAG: hypothetical protein U1F66_07955 [bacterium]